MKNAGGRPGKGKWACTGEARRLGVVFGDTAAKVLFMLYRDRPYFRNLRQMAAELGVCKSAVQDAVDRLRRRGLVVSRSVGRSGAYHLPYKLEIFRGRKEA